MNTRLSLIPVMAFTLLSSGCSVQKAALRAIVPIMENGVISMMAETNLDVAEAALASNLKLTEGMILTDPGNEDLLMIAAQGYTAYTLAFVEDENEAEAKTLYRRARDYANHWLIETQDIDLLAIDNLSEFETAVSALDRDALPGVFWLANSWGSEILLALDDIRMISDLPRVEALMRFVLATDESYFFGGAHLFFGGYYGGRPPMLGGDIGRAREHLDRQLELTNNTVLLGRLFKVRYVHLRELDEDGARAELGTILLYDVFSGPEDTRLLNRVAQRKAQDLLENLEEYL